MGTTIGKLEIEDYPVIAALKRRKSIRVFHKPCASYGYQVGTVPRSVSTGGYRVTK